MKGIIRKREDRLSYGKYKGRKITDVCKIDNKYVKREVKAKRLELPKYLKV